MTHCNTKFRVHFHPDKPVDLEFDNKQGATHPGTPSMTISIPTRVRADDSESNRAEAESRQESASDEPDEANPHSPPDRSSSKANRLSAEIGGGILGLAIGSSVGGLPGYLLLEPAIDGDASGEGAMGTVAAGLLGVVVGSVGLVVGGSLGTAGGVTLAGDLAGGNGEFFSSLIGSILGLFAGGMTVGLLPTQSEGVFWAGLTAIPLFTVGGGILGYEAKHTDHKTSASNVTIAPVQLSTLSDESHSFGLSVRF